MFYKSYTNSIWVLLEVNQENHPLSLIFSYDILCAINLFIQTLEAARIKFERSRFSTSSRDKVSKI
jgi:hypothetical protein